MSASQNPAPFTAKTAADPALFDLLVLGSGIAGLAAARLAQNDGKSVLVIDKGRRLGGQRGRSYGRNKAEDGQVNLAVREDPACHG